jgi:electron transport complex protein RnfE
MNKNSKLWIVLKGIIAENPVLVLILGTCPVLAVSTSIVSAISMGIAATLVLICSNTLISLLRKIIPDTVRIPCYIVVIAGFVTIIQMLLQAFLPDIYTLLGTWLALIVVNCIILGRAEMYARKHNPLDSALDGLGMGIGFLVALVLMATVREVLGNGSFAGFEIPFLANFKISVLTKAPGGFLVYGILIGVMNKLTEKKGGVKKKSFSCEGCPSSHICNKTSCSEVTEIAAEALETAVEAKEAEIQEAKEVGENA